jgi:hypothetical protein
VTSAQFFGGAVHRFVIDRYFAAGRRSAKIAP